MAAARDGSYLRVMVSGLALALGAQIGLCVWGSPAAAQADWMPTVATSPGVALSPYPGPAPGRVSPMIDPRFFPSPHTAASARKAVPQGAWSPIVTGALPPNAPSAVDDVPLTPAPAGAFVPPLAVPPLQGAPNAKGGREKVIAATEADAPAGAAAGAKAPAADAAPPAAAAPGSETAPPAPADAAPSKPGPLEALPPDATAAQQYCFNTGDAAADARFAWQAKKIKDMEAELEKRSQQLEAKTEEYKAWLARRDEFSRKAQEKLVGFYAKMRPDAAALQLTAMDEETAAALLTKLEPKVASLVMGEMDPVRAAKIASIISGAAKIPPDRKRAVPQPAAKPPPQSTDGSQPSGRTKS